MPTITDLYGGAVLRVARKALKNGEPLDAIRWSIDSKLGKMSADDFEVTTRNPADYLDVDEANDRITLRVGYITASGTELLVGQIVEGIIDEPSLEVVKDGVLVRLRGKDQLVKTVNRTFAKNYLRKEPPAPLGGRVSGTVKGPITATVDGTIAGSIDAVFNGTANFNLNGTINGTPVDGLITGEVNGTIVGTINGTFAGTLSGTLDATVDWDVEASGAAAVIPTSDIPYVTGSFMASQVAQEAAASVGLTLTWQAPDYELKADFEANGRVLDVIQQLAEPFSRPEPFTVDVYLQGTVVFVKQREIEPVASPDSTLAVRDARISSWREIKHAPLKFGRVHLEGELIPGADQPNTSADTPSLELLPFGSVTVDQAGTVTATIFGTVLMRRPENLALRTVQTTFAPQTPSANLSASTGGGIASQQITDTLWIDDIGVLILDERPSVGTPRLIEETKSIESEKDGVLIETSREGKTYAYDNRQMLTTETTLHYRRSGADTGTTSSSMQVSEQQVRTLADAGPGHVKETADNYAVKKSTGSLLLVQSESRIQGGFRPGALGGSGGAGSETGTPIVLEETFSEDLDAEDVDYSNPQLARSALEQIMDQYRQAQGKRQSEIQFTAAGMPWLLRGSVIQFTSLEAPKGTAIPLPAAVAANLRIDLDESTQQPFYRTQVQSIGWQ